MAERRHRDRKADEERQRAYDQRRGDHNAPKRDGDWILPRYAQRSGNGGNEPDIVVKLIFNSGGPYSPHK